MLGQPVRIPFAPDNVVDDGEAGLAGDVADHMLELHVHLAEGLLDVLNMVRGVADQHGALSQVAPQAPNLGLGPEGPRQQSIGVQLLQPLAVQHVGLATRYILDPPGVHQHHLKSPVLQDSEQRYPVDPGGLHDHALDLTVGEPVGQSVQVSSIGGKLSYLWLGTV